MSKRLSIEVFVERANKVHNRRYDYTKVIYKNNSTKIEILCPIHGVFLQKASHHLAGVGCPDCVSRRPHTHESFVMKAQSIHGDTYDYSSVVYVNSHTPVIILCKHHGAFMQRPAYHMSGRGCSQCAQNTRLGNDVFVTRAVEVHGAKYTYAHVEYRNTHTKVSITCPTHGDFLAYPSHFLRGIGCPRCCNSLGGNAVHAWLDNMNIHYTKEYKDSRCRDKKTLAFDFALSDPQTGVIGLIEYDGQQHFEPCNLFSNGRTFMTTVVHDAIKNQFCEDYHIPLLRIPYWNKKKIPEILAAFVLPLLETTHRQGDDI